jgi:hypothetical protein
VIPIIIAHAEIAFLPASAFDLIIDGADCTEKSASLDLVRNFNSDGNIDSKFSTPFGLSARMPWLQEVESSGMGRHHRYCRHSHFLLLSSLLPLLLVAALGFRQEQGTEVGYLCALAWISSF